MVKITLNLDTSQYNLDEETGTKIKTRILDLTQSELLANLRKESPVDTGRLQGSWMTFNKGDTREIMTSTIYADYLDKGTGIYGPKGKPITPKKKDGFLVFTPKGENKPVFAKSIQGIKPRKFVEKSINKTTQRIEDFAIRAIQLV